MLCYSPTVINWTIKKGSKMKTNNTNTIRFKRLKMVLQGVIVLLVVCSAVKGFAGSSMVIDLNMIAIIESSGNPLAIGDNGKAIGLYQLHAPVVKDYNLKHGTAYSHKQMHNAVVSSQVANWYLNVEIPRLLKHYKKAVTTENVLTAYNMGIGNVLKGRKAVKYIAKYNKK